MRFYIRPRVLTGIGALSFVEQQVEQAVPPGVRTAGPLVRHTFLARRVLHYLAILLALAPCFAQEAVERARIKDALFVPNPLPTLDAITHSRFDPAPGVTAERVTYATQFGMRVPAILYLPKPMPQAKIPALIVVNGHGGDKYAWYAMYSGILYARAGAAVLTYDPIGEGERNGLRRSGTREHDQVQEPVEALGRRMGGLMMTDVMQAVSYLSQRREVDPKRIAAAGYSMGSFVLSLACALETRLTACVLVGGGNLDGPGEYWDRSKPMCEGEPYKALSFLGDRAAAIYSLHASRGATLIFNGLEDTVVAIPTHGKAFFDDLRRRVVALRGNSAGVFETGFVEGVSHRPFFVTKPVASWLHRQLNFPNWTAEAVAAMPQTRIGDWAAKENVEMDKSYSNEQREGGTPALGTGVPGLRRADLHVLPEADWQARKGQFVYESWLKEARARVLAASTREADHAGKWLNFPQRDLASDTRDPDLSIPDRSIDRFKGLR